MNSEHFLRSWPQDSSTKSQTLIRQPSQVLEPSSFKESKDMQLLEYLQLPVPHSIIIEALIDVVWESLPTCLDGHPSFRVL